MYNIYVHRLLYFTVQISYDGEQSVIIIIIDVKRKTLLHASEE